MEAFDIVLFSGKGMVSNLIKLGSLSRFSHCGIMIDDEHLLESTTLNGANGVRIIKIRDLLKEYKGSVYVRHYKHEPTYSQIEKLTNFAKAVNGEPYEKSLWDLLTSAIDWLPNPREDLTSYFCSELVAETLKMTDILETDRPSDDYSPKEISEILPDKYGEIFRLIK